MKFFVLLPAVVCLSFAQAPAPVASFEAVQVDPVSAFAFRVARPVINANRYEYKSANMNDFVATAYGVEPDKVLGGPMWVEYDRFDIIGRIPRGASADKASEMLRSALIDRFGLVTKAETRMLPALALTVGKKSLLKAAEGSGNGCMMSVKMAGAGEGPLMRSECHNMTVAGFAQQLRNFPGMRGLTTNPILDKTGLEGVWDFNFELAMNAGTVSQAQISSMLESQLGLKLETVENSFPVIVIEKVNRVPTANAPADVESLKVKAPAEFEVADVKPSDPAMRRMGMQFPPGGRGGRVTISGMPLGLLIQQAWDLRPDKIVGAPKWLNDDRFDIVAKLPTDPETGAPLITTQEFVWPMVRKLLADRFKLVTHFEEQPATAYKLMAVKPKLAPGDPAQRTKCSTGPGADGKDPRKTTPALSQLVTCRNVTMDQFALLLPNFGVGYLDNPVVNATHLDGIWTMTLSFSPAYMVQGGGRGGVPMVLNGGFVAVGRGPGDAGASDEAAAPNGAISFFAAIEKLGLKLEMEKRPVKVLVIDHVEQKPTEN